MKTNILLTALLITVAGSLQAATVNLSKLDTSLETLTAVNIRCIAVTSGTHLQEDSNMWSPDIFQANGSGHINSTFFGAVAYTYTPIPKPATSSMMSLTAFFAFMLHRHKAQQFDS